MQPINAPSVRNYNNTGTRNNGFQYKLMPLSFNLQQKGNSNTNFYTDKRNKFSIGDIVTGICLYDYKEHTGYITQIIYDEKTNNPLSVYIMDYKTKFNLPLNYSTLEKEYKSNIYENLHFDKSIKKVLNENLFDDIYNIEDEKNIDTEIVDEYITYNIGDIYYKNKNPYAICCGSKKQFKDNIPRFLLLNKMGYDLWSIDFDKIPEFKNIYTDECILKTKHDMIRVDEDGYENTQIIKNNYNISDFPAFEYCTELGNNVYLPSIDELEILYLNKNEIKKRADMQKRQMKFLFNEVIELSGKVKRITSSSQTSKYTTYTIDFTYGKVEDKQKSTFMFILPFVKI